MRVAVTGASGFIGSHVVAELVAQGHEPIAFVRSEARLAQAMRVHDLDLPEHVIGDVTDHDAVAQLCAGVDAIVHSAGVVTTKGADESAATDTNVEGTRTVVTSANEAGLDPIIHLSSVAAMFPERLEPIGSPMTSDDPVTSNQSLYARTKAGAERVVRAAQADGAPVVIFYPGGVFGPDDPGTSDLIDGTLLMLDKGAFVLPRGRGNTFIDVRDLRVAIVNALKPGQGPRRYMAGGTWVGWDEWIGYFVAHCKTKIRIIALSPSAMHKIAERLDRLAVRVPRFDNPLTADTVKFMSWAKPTDDSKLHDELGVQYRPVDDSVRDFVAWLRVAGRITD